MPYFGTMRRYNNIGTVASIQNFARYRIVIFIGFPQWGQIPVVVVPGVVLSWNISPGFISRASQIAKKLSILILRLNWLDTAA